MFQSISIYQSENEILIQMCLQAKQKGQGLVEYAIIVMVVVLLAVTLGALFTPQISALYAKLGQVIASAP